MFNQLPIDYTMTYAAEYVDADNVRIVATSADGNSINKRVVSKLQILADLQTTKNANTSALATQTANTAGNNGMIDDLTSIINAVSAPQS